MSKDKLPLIWPRPQELVLTGRAVPATTLRLEVHGGAAWLEGESANVARVLNRAARRRIVAMRAHPGATSLLLTSMDALPEGFLLAPVKQAEGYLLALAPKRFVLAASDAAGAFYGAISLAQILASGRQRSAERLLLPQLSLRDWPSLTLRGAHCYLPARRQLRFFRRFLDFLAELKCNALILEIGGGMEYDRHPEINRAWRRFVQEAWAYDPDRDPHRESMSSRRHPEHPRGPVALQASRYFPKDSIHPELAGGECLTKDEVRRIVADCAARHIQVIPEVQSLSHSYYLCCAHPEIAERRDDPWPDTYCPSNPKSYELLFDVMDEVIEVVRPRIMHIGHDEAYTFAVCPKCRGRSGHELLAEDVTRIHDFLADRGVKTMMWGDKFMNLPSGGVERRRTDPVTGKEWFQPATWQAADRVPRDLMIMDWYWSLHPNSEDLFAEHGFTVTYGNFSPLTFEGWEARAGKPCVLGAEMSSWCAVEPYAFGHNGVFYDFFPGADMLWRGEKLPRAQVCALMARWMTPRIEKLTGQHRWLVSGASGRAVPLAIGSTARELPVALQGQLASGRRLSTVLGTGSFAPLVGRGSIARAIVLDRARPQAEVAVGRSARKLLLLLGATMKDVPFELTFNAFHRKPAALLECLVEYYDGRRARFRSIYGDDLGDVAGRWPFPRTHWLCHYCFRGVLVEVGEAGAGETTASPAQEAAKGAVMPPQRDVTAPGQKLFAQEWTNPRPRARIRRLTLSLGPDATDQGEVIIAAISLVV